MNPIEFKAEGHQSIWACGECGMIRAHQRKEEAEACCVCTAEGCGAVRSKHHSLCPDHLAEADRQRLFKQAEKEEQLFAEAEKLEDWDGPVFFWGNQRYYPSLDDAIVDLADGYDLEINDLPEYVWACSEALISVNPDSVVENLCEQMTEEFEEPDQVEVFGQDELRKALETFNEAQGSVMWLPDYSRAVLIKRDLEEYLAVRR